jgi:hypothetical protein
MHEQIRMFKLRCKLSSLGQFAMIARNHTRIILNLVLCMLVSGAAHSAFAGPVEIQSIQIIPSETTVGTYPDITGSVTATRSLRRGKTIVITVIAVVVQPDHIVKSWTWKNERMRTGDVRSFSVPKKYKIKLAGTYKVDFNVYSKDMLPLHRLSKTFIAVERRLPPTKKTTAKKERARIKATSRQETTRQAEIPYFAVGLYADTLHNAGGATMLLWPFKYVGLQASYSVGSFAIAEGRLLARLPLSSGITPYLGAGYLNVTTNRAIENIGIKARFQNSGSSGVIGLEVPLGKNVLGSVEISSASIKFKKEVVSGSITGTASVKYAPVTIGINIVYFLF